MAADPDKPSTVEPVTRAFQILEALNQQTVTTLAALHNKTGLPKPTLVRLLDTLIAAGYVQRISRATGYSLAERVLRLSGGFRHSDRVVEASRPFLTALTAQHKWSVGLATTDGDAMIIRTGTRHESPFSTDPNYTGQRLPMLISALGRAYLAFCAEEEREAILSLLRNSSARSNAMARDEGAISRLLANIRKRGFANAIPVRNDPMRGIAVPVMENGHAVASITMRYFASMMSEDEAARRYLASMQDAAAAIAATLAVAPGD
ncbi:MAG: DNA-binding transcriptional regulator [Parvibaculum sp.]|jgi:IclR family mhp operon transcriptional activator|uniref:DNA-binding transcriptional regulator n=1 Tax=Parvibaculum sp. TaxID=2024848 RepID=UPI00283D8B55|nr:DNA-binding transcriptional regulator [Parvibaculum sp.]MDR3497808.1 DNA-binding transcriptional regulator [Parvibaculum sp.]